MNLMLSIVVITYNQEKYIRQAIESIINQPKNFEYEILVCDDASTDNTPAILKDIQVNYPDILLNIMINTVNCGAAQNLYNLFLEARGKYITVLEGDDYWEITGELQKSIDFLESSPQYGAISREVKVLDEKNNIIQGNNIKIGEKFKYTNIENYFKGSPIKTCIYRNFYKNKNEDFSIIYKSARMVAEIAIGFLIVEHCDIYHTGMAWEVKRTNRVEGSFNYNSINSLHTIFEEEMTAWKYLSEVKKQYDFFPKYVTRVVNVFYTCFFGKDWKYICNIFKWVEKSKRSRLILEIMRNAPKAFGKYIHDKRLTIKSQI